MPILCKNTNENADIRCCVCGQKFAMLWERQSRSERAAALNEIQKTLRSHHRSQRGPEAHPAGGILIPERIVSIAPAGVAILGHAPTWAL
jgi:hypothetical protein